MAGRQDVAGGGVEERYRPNWAPVVFSTARLSLRFVLSRNDHHHHSHLHVASCSTSINARHHREKLYRRKKLWMHVHIAALCLHSVGQGWSDVDASGGKVTSPIPPRADGRQYKTAICWVVMGPFGKTNTCYAHCIGWQPRSEFVKSNRSKGDVVYRSTPLELLAFRLHQESRTTLRFSTVVTAG